MERFSSDVMGEDDLSCLYFIDNLKLGDLFYDQEFMCLVSHGRMI